MHVKHIQISPKDKQVHRSLTSSQFRSMTMSPVVLKRSPATSTITSVSRPTASLLQAARKLRTMNSYSAFFWGSQLDSPAEYLAGFRD